MHNVLINLALTEENDGAFSGEWHGGGEVHEKISPVDGKSLGKYRTASADDYERVLSRATDAFEKWRVTPGPVVLVELLRPQYRQLPAMPRPVELLAK